MFGRRQRREERLYWEGFRDALVTGTAFGPNGKPALFRDDEPSADWTRYRQGFEDGKRAGKRIHRDALVSEVRSLSLKLGDSLVIKFAREISKQEFEQIYDLLKPHFPDNKILIFQPDMEPSVIQAEPVTLDGKAIAEAVARSIAKQLARA